MHSICEYQDSRYFASPQSPGDAMSGSALQLEKLKYLGVVFTGDGKRNKEIDTRIGTANAVLPEFYRSVVTKQELSKIAFAEFSVLI